MQTNNYRTPIIIMSFCDTDMSKNGQGINKYSNNSIIKVLGIIQMIIRMKKIIIEEYLLMTSIHIGYFPVQLSKQVFVLWCFTIYK